MMVERGLMVELNRENFIVVIDQLVVTVATLSVRAFVNVVFELCHVIMMMVVMIVCCWRMAKSTTG